MNILITGAAGHIGASYSEYLLNKNNNLKIIGVDNFLTGTEDNLKNCKKNSQYIFYDADCNDINSIKKIFEMHDIDYVFHYAACAGVERTLNNPNLVYSDLDGIKNIVQLCLLHNVKKLAYSSSSEVYGEPRELPLSVENSPINPTLPYAIIKAAGEVYIKSMLHNSSVNYCIFRFFNTYGPYQSNDYVVKNFVNHAVKNEVINIYGDGCQTRTFLYVDDNSAACFELMFNDFYKNITVNIGSDEIINISNLAQMIISTLGSSSEIIHLPARVFGDSRLRQAENKLFLDIIKRPLISLEDGILMVADSLSRGC